MIYQNEITVKITCSYDELSNILQAKGFTIAREYSLKDTYMFKENVDVQETDNYEMLSDYLMVRNVDDKEFQITHKYKEYDSNKGIKRQGKKNCDCYSETDAIELLSEIGYKPLFVIDNDNKIYQKGQTRIVASKVNGEYICVEYDCINGRSVEETITEFNSLGIPYDASDYFINKSLIELEKIKTENIKRR